MLVFSLLFIVEMILLTPSFTMSFKTILTWATVSCLL